MSQRQQYAIVPHEPTGDMVRAGQCYVGLYQVFTEMVKAAPPPPDQVLSDLEIARLYIEWDETAGASYGDLIRMAERTVLTRLTEPK